jgi:dsDNA-specific endonuclease/ATPase MutS2
MKAFGLAACMAKAGLLLPAQAPARLPAFSCVLADIGDEQSLTANLSTFSGHIKRYARHSLLISCILKLKKASLL